MGWIRVLVERGIVLCFGTIDSINRWYDDPCSRVSHQIIIERILELDSSEFNNPRFRHPDGPVVRLDQNQSLNVVELGSYSVFQDPDNSRV
jgi:hypothetical protein